MSEAALLKGLGVSLVTAEKKDYPPLWTDCEDLEIYDDHGQLIWAGPRYLRCTRAECVHLVTHGMVRTGGCWCGNRRLGVALRLKKDERDKLQQGYYPLCQWEYEQIQPTLPEGKHLGWGREVWEEEYA